MASELSVLSFFQGGVCFYFVTHSFLQTTCGYGEVSSTGFAEGITVEEVFAITVVES